MFGLRDGVQLSGCGRMRSKVLVAKLINKTPRCKQSGLTLGYRCVYCVLLMLGMMHPAHKDQIFRN